MNSQEVSKPVMIGVIALVVIVIAIMGWHYLQPQPYPGFQAPPGNPAAAGQRMLPGMNVERQGGPTGAPR